MSRRLLDSPIFWRLLLNLTDLIVVAFWLASAGLFAYWVFQAGVIHGQHLPSGVP